MIKFFWWWAKALWFGIEKIQVFIFIKLKMKFACIVKLNSIRLQKTEDIYVQNWKPKRKSLYAQTKQRQPLRTDSPDFFFRSSSIESIANSISFSRTFRCFEFQNGSSDHICCILFFQSFNCDFFYHDLLQEAFTILGFWNSLSSGQLKDLAFKTSNWSLLVFRSLYSLYKNLYQFSCGKIFNFHRISNNKNVSQFHFCSKKTSCVLNVVWCCMSHKPENNFLNYRFLIATLAIKCTFFGRSNTQKPKLFGFITLSSVFHGNNNRNRTEFWLSSILFFWSLSSVSSRFIILDFYSATNFFFCVFIKRKGKSFWKFFDGLILFSCFLPCVSIFDLYLFFNFCLKLTN